MSKYTEENPVLSFRIKRDRKELLEDIAKDMKINPQKLCQGIIDNFISQHDLFDLVIKKPEKRMKVEIKC
jgi:hypothetical protein